MSSSARKIAAALFDVRREDVLRILPLASAYGLVLASLYVLKPARNALFLANLGVGQLPYVLMLVALVGGATATLYARFARSIPVDRLIARTFVFLIAVLIGFRVLIPMGGAWVFYAFYIWVNLYGLLATSLIWLLANSVFNPREARRLFGWIGIGGIAGAILGGFFTRRAVEAVGTENLLVVCALILAPCLLLLRVSRTMDVPTRRRRPRNVGFSSILRSDLLRKLAIMSGLISIVAVIVEVQFNEIVNQSFPTKDEKAAFFGELFAYLSAFAFLFQLILTPRILRSFGVGSALLFLPVSLALGSTAFLVIPGLWAALLLKVGDGGFRHSIHKSAAEVLFLPVPAELKGQAKLFLDTTVDTLGTGLGALLVLGLNSALGVPYLHLSFLAIGLIAACVWVGIRMRRAYVDAFRTALERREMDLGDIRTSIGDASTVSALLAALKSENERQLVYVLDMLSSARSMSLIQPVRPLLGHRSGDVRKLAVRVLERQGDQSLIPEIEQMLVDPDRGVRIEAVYFLCRHGEGDRIARLDRLLSDPDDRIQSAALGCIAEHGDLGARHLIDEAVVQRFLSREGHERERSRAEIAATLGKIDDENLRKHLRGLTSDPSPIVVTSTIESAGHARDGELIPWLMEKLLDSRYRAHARRALASFGSEIIGALERTLANEEIHLSIRRNIPRVLSAIPAQESVNVLVEHLGAGDPLLRHHVLKSLGELRSKYPHLKFPADRIEDRLSNAARITYAMIQIIRVLDGERKSGNGRPAQEGRENPSRSLLSKALHEKRGRMFEEAFRLLGLLYSPTDMNHAYQAIISEKKATRANAIEFLDNVLAPKIKRYLLPLLEEHTAEDLIRRGREIFRDRIETRRGVLEHLLSSGDAWLKACAVYEISASGVPELRSLIRAAREDRDPVVRETVDLVLSSPS